VMCSCRGTAHQVAWLHLRSDRRRRMEWNGIALATAQKSHGHANFRPPFLALELMDFFSLTKVRIMQLLEHSQRATHRVFTEPYHVCKSFRRRNRIQVFQRLIFGHGDCSKLGTYLKLWETSSMEACSLPIRSSIRNNRLSSFSVTKLIATPPFPVRAVLPTRWVYSSGSLGRSQLTTIATSSISKPRAPTSVETRTGTTADLNSDREASLSRWVSRECNPVLRIDSAFNTFTRYATVWGLAQNIMVGGGCRNSSSWESFCKGFLAFAFAAFAMGGARRKDMVLSGGLHNK